MFKSISHQGNTNQNHIEITTLRQLEWQKRTRQEATNVGEDVEKGDPLTLLVGMHVGTATLENSVEVP